MPEEHWGEGNHDGPALIDAVVARTPEVLGRWYETSSAALGWAFDAWYDGAVSAAAAGLAVGSLDRGALAALGAARAARGRSERETLTDLRHALGAADAGVDVDEAGARAAVIGGFRGQAPRDSWFGDARALSRRLRRLYVTDDDTRVSPARSHVLLLVDVDLTWLHGGERALALASAAERVHRQFPFADPVACLAESRFAVVVHRHPGLAVGSEALQMWLANEPLLAGATKVSLAPLPEEAGDVGRFVRALTGAQRPLRVHVYEPRAAATGGPGAELLEAAVPTCAVRRERRRMRLTVLLDGSRMLAAAAVALIVAVGVGRVAGPVGVPSLTPSSLPFALAPGAPAADDAASPSGATGALVVAAPLAPSTDVAVEGAPGVRRGAARGVTPRTSPAPAGGATPGASAPTVAAAVPVVSVSEVAAVAEEPWPPRNDEAGGHGPKHDDPPGKGDGGGHDAGTQDGGSASSASADDSKPRVRG